MDELFTFSDSKKRNLHPHTCRLVNRLHFGLVGDLSPNHLPIQQVIERCFGQSVIAENVLMLICGLVSLWQICSLNRKSQFVPGRIRYVECRHYPVHLTCDFRCPNALTYATRLLFIHSTDASFINSTTQLPAHIMYPVSPYLKQLLPYRKYWLYNSP